MIYQPIVFDRPTGETLGPSFEKMDDAEAWKADRLAGSRFWGKWGYVAKFKDEAEMKRGMYGEVVG